MSRQLVAAAQLGPASETRDATVERIVRLIDEAGRAGVELVVFPELCLSPYFPSEIHGDPASFAETSFPSASTAPIVEAAARNRVAVVVPFAELADGRMYNGAAVVDSTGEVIGRYRKVHIPGTHDVDPSRPLQNFEKRYFEPGDLGFPIHASPVGPMGVAICYDRRFPETYRCYGLQGASVIAIGYNTPYDQTRPNALTKARQSQEVSIRAAAHANAVYLIVAGKAGVEGGSHYIGDSCIVDHDGQVIARAETDGDELVVGAFDRDALEEHRRAYSDPYWADRRTDLYGPITGRLAPVLPASMA